MEYLLTAGTAVYSHLSRSCSHYPPSTHQLPHMYEVQTAAVLFSPALETDQDVSTLERLVERRVQG